MDLFGAEEIIKALIEYGETKNEKRSTEKRYNLIMAAIYGDEAESYMIKKPSNRPMERSITDFDLLLLEMYEAAQENEYKTYKDLAEDFIDEINFIGGRENAVKRLAARYSENKERLSAPEERIFIRHIVKVHEEQWGYEGTLYQEMRSLKQILCENGWPVWVDFE